MEIRQAVIELKNNLISEKLRDSRKIKKLELQPLNLNEQRKLYALRMNNNTLDREIRKLEIILKKTREEYE